MVAVSREEIEPFLARVRLAPGEGPHLRVREASTRPQARGGRLDPAGHGRAEEDRVLVDVGRQPPVDDLQLLLCLGVLHTVVPEEAHPSPGGQDGGGLGRSRRRLDPVPGLPAHQQVEATAPVLPGLELSLLHVDAGSSRHGSHAGVGLHPEDTAAPLGEEARGDACPAPDVEDRRTDTIADEIVDHGGGIARSGPVVLLRVRPEGLGAAAILVEHPLIVPPREEAHGSERDLHQGLVGVVPPFGLFP